MESKTSSLIIWTYCKTRLYDQKRFFLNKDELILQYLYLAFNNLNLINFFLTTLIILMTRLDRVFFTVLNK